MEQFNNRTDVVKAFERLWKKEYNIVGKDLKSFYNNAIRSKEYRDIVYNSNLLEFGSFYGQDFFNDASLVIASYQNIGTYESIINICKGIFGEQVEVLFTGDDMQDINISSSANTEFPIEDVEGSNVVDIVDNQLVAIDNRLSLEANKIEQGIRLFLPVGIKHNITLGKKIGIKDGK